MGRENRTISKDIKGFTLVELIVVITILTILGTIAFLSLQGQSATARDSKRKTDLSSLSTKVSISMWNGVSLLSLIGTSTGAITPNANIAGAAQTISTYNVGTPNYTALDISATDFLDPKSQDYRLGVTTVAGSVYQLAATLEADNAGNPVPNAFVVGTYSPRGATSTATAVPTISGNNLLFPVATGDIGKFKTGDTVTLSVPPTGCTPPTKVLSISSDLSTITIACAAGTPSTNATSQITLGSGAIAPTEIAGLIGAIGNLANPVTTGDTTNLPY